MDENRIYIKDKLVKEIKEYCKLNEIEDVDEFANECTINGFTIIKFGTSPLDNINRENNGIKEFKDNVKGIIKRGTQKEGGRKGKGNSSIEGSTNEEVSRESEEPTKDKEKKENIKVRKIRVINKD